MAYRTYKRNYRRGRKTSYKSKQRSASNLKKFAYQLGRVKAGLGGDTQVRDAYHRGLNMKLNQKSRKPLY